MPPLPFILHGIISVTFLATGQHYWYNISRDMDCENFFPVFLLYNGGRLNGFGWNTQGDLKSSRYEHPTADKLKVRTLNAQGLSRHLHSEWIQV